MSLLLEWGDGRLPESYWEHVYPEPNTGCYVWGGPALSAGYGKCVVDGISDLAHRHMLVAVGSLDRDDPTAHGLHRCDFPPCVRSDHLFVGTAGDNIRDAVAKGRHVVHNKPDTPEICPRCGEDRHPVWMPCRLRFGWYCAYCSRDVRQERADRRTPEEAAADRARGAANKLRLKNSDLAVKIYCSCGVGPIRDARGYRTHKGRMKCDGDMRVLEETTT